MPDVATPPGQQPAPEPLRQTAEPSRADDTARAAPGVPSPTDPGPAAGRPAAKEEPVDLSAFAASLNLVRAEAPAHAPTTPAPTAPQPANVPVTAQLAPALVSVALSRTDAGSDITIRLDPLELGQVQLRMTRAGDAGPAQIEVAVERPETLRLLERDRSGLEQALDRAGVPAEGRVIHLVLARPASDPVAAPAAPAPAPVPAPAPAPASSAAPHLGAGTGGQPQEHPRDSPQPGRAAVQHFVATSASGDHHAIPTWFRPQRLGVDITA